MAELENNRHERFAQLLAGGVPQGNAYAYAGYAENKGAASRLAHTQKIKKRVAELLNQSEPVDLPPDERPSYVRAAPTANRTGHVYALRIYGAEDGEVSFKVGFTKRDVKQRCREIAAVSPYRMEVYRSVAVIGAREAEKAAHHMLSDFRQDSGEIFHCTPHAIDECFDSIEKDYSSDLTKNVEGFLSGLPRRYRGRNVKISPKNQLVSVTLTDVATPHNVVEVPFGAPRHMETAFKLGLEYREQCAAMAGGAS